MPATLTLPSPIVSVTRHCTGLLFALPIAGQASCVASFTVRTVREDGTITDTPESSVTLDAAEITALPSFPDAYAQLGAAVHSKRNTYD